MESDRHRQQGSRLHYCKRVLCGCCQSTYCSNMVKHCEVLRRSVHVVNLDPAAEHFNYPVLAGMFNLFLVFVQTG